MSQIFGPANSNPPGSNEFVTDINSPAVPAAGVLDVFGGSTSSGNVNGIQTSGSSGGNVLTIQLTNRVIGSITTTNATPTTLAILALAGVPAVYSFDMNIAALDTTDSLGAGYQLFGTVRSDGTNTYLVGTPDKVKNEEGTLAGSSIDVSILAGGLGSNNAIVQVTGVAATSIDWNMVGYYVAVS
jgi:hypothetical protein